MKVPGLPALALALSSLLVFAWSIGAASCGPGVWIWDCADPSGTYLGTADSTTPNACPCVAACCTDGPPNGKPYPQPGVAFHGSCSSDAGITCGPGTVLVGNECVPASDGGDPGDAAEDGPLGAACSGTCWPVFPLDWSPVLLWTGADAGPPSCPWETFAVFDGVADDGTSTAALACATTVSGTCGMGYVCGPAPVSGFSSCIMYESSNVPCVEAGPYPTWRLFYEGTAPEPVLPSTFCCPGAPDGGPTPT
jgi:hypothetical protein